MAIMRKETPRPFSMRSSSLPRLPAAISHYRRLSEPAVDRPDKSALPIRMNVAPASRKAAVLDLSCRGRNPYPNPNLTFSLPPDESAQTAGRTFFWSATSRLAKLRTQSR